MPRRKRTDVSGTENGKTIAEQWPKRLPLNWIERVLTVIGLVILVVTVLFVLMRYGSMPDQVPTHYGIGGEADGFGSKTEIWLILIVDIACVGGIFIANFFPTAINIPPAMMKRSPEEIIHATRLMVGWVGVVCAVLFAYLIGATVLVSATIHEIFVYALVALMMIPMIPYCIYLLRP